MTDIHRTRALKCPSCGAPCDTHTGDGASAPAPHDATVCSKCGHISIFGDDLELRHPTHEEALQIMLDPQLIATSERVRAELFRRPGAIPPAHGVSVYQGAMVDRMERFIQAVRDMPSGCELGLQVGSIATPSGRLPAIVIELAYERHGFSVPEARMLTHILENSVRAYPDVAVYHYVIPDLIMAIRHACDEAERSHGEPA